ncbi:hypothetical protein CEXT_492811 [Caerostris extrusa]|uniref:Uncharacterized protein n=1 Tax=Caerostris extrusa TaxID=172846 RepID=A0AAV4RUN3_CAEEX|nr:hypothetical protein CEXT_492811 [Caerostris extrusa]
MTSTGKAPGDGQDINFYIFKGFSLEADCQYLIILCRLMKPRQARLPNHEEKLPEMAKTSISTSSKGFSLEADGISSLHYGARGQPIDLITLKLSSVL